MLGQLFIEVWRSVEPGIEPKAFVSTSNRIGLGCVAPDIGTGKMFRLSVRVRLDPARPSFHDGADVVNADVWRLDMPDLLRSMMRP